MKWRRIPEPPAPEIMLCEKVGPFAVEVEQTDYEGKPAFVAWRLVPVLGRFYLDRSLLSPEDALRRGAAKLGFEPDDGAP